MRSNGMNISDHESLYHASFTLQIKWAIFLLCNEENSANKLIFTGSIPIIRNHEWDERNVH